MQRTQRSFYKERENVAFFWKEHLPNPEDRPFPQSFEGFDL